MPQSVKCSSWWTRAALLAVAVGAMLFGLWALFSPAVPPQKSQELRKGMTGGEVLEILGKPLRVSPTAEGGSEWRYGTPVKRSALRIVFSQEEHVIQYHRDEITSGKIKGACYWGLAWAWAKTGAADKASDMRFRSMCASMEWESLRFRCEDRAAAAELNAEIWKFFNSQGHLIQNYHAEAWATGDPAVLNVVVSKPARKVLENHLNERGYTAE